MKRKSFAFTVNSLEKADQIIFYSKFYNVAPILHFKYYILKGFGSEFIISFRDLLIAKYDNLSFNFYVDCGSDRGLALNMIQNNIEYIKLRGSSIILKKINIITNKNKVLLNPSFNIVDCRKIKKINLKIDKLYSKDKNEN